jgi:hypothetical protein
MGRDALERHDARSHRTNEGTSITYSRARALPDGGDFQAFIPLAFHPDNNQMHRLQRPPPRTRCACTQSRG